MEQEIELAQIWGIIKKRWLFFAILPLLAALISGGISFYILKPIYQASATLIVGKTTSNLEDPLARQLLEANRLLAKTYGEIANSRMVKEQVIAQLSLGLTSDQLNSKISINQVKDSEILQITVTDTDPQLAADIANVTVWKFSTAVVDIKKIDSVSIIDRAVRPTAPIKPNKLMNILIAFSMGLIAALGLSLCLEYLDNTIRNSKEAEELLGLSVLGVIPDDQAIEDDEGREPCASTI